MVEENIKYEFKNKILLNEATSLNKELVILGESLLSSYLNELIANNLIYVDEQIKYFYDEIEINNARIKLLANDNLVLLTKKLKIDDIVDEYEKNADLLKALIGAIYLDSKDIKNYLDYNFSFEKDLLLELDINSRHIFDWEKGKFKSIPNYDITKENDIYFVKLKLDGIDTLFEGSSTSKIKALSISFENAYNYIVSNKLELKLKDVVGHADNENCISQLQELWEKGYINEPIYKITLKGTVNGMDLWKCRILVDGYKETFSFSDSSKKKAKRLAAYEMLKYILEEE